MLAAPAQYAQSRNVGSTYVGGSAGWAGTNNTLAVQYLSEGGGLGQIPGLAPMASMNGPVQAQYPGYPVPQQGHFLGAMSAPPVLPVASSSMPQPMLDSDPVDGPVSVAYGLRPELVEIRRKLPAPATKQYLHKELFRQNERTVDFHPRPDADVAGFVLATGDPNGAFGGPHPANEDERERMNLDMNDQRLVFQCISGSAMMHWNNQQDFNLGIYGARRAPRPIAWWDLRKAYDVVVELGDPDFDVAAAKFTVNMFGGNLEFCIEVEEDIPVWYNAIRSVIQDAAWHHSQQGETPARTRKRWPAAVGVAQAIAESRPLGERALAILFHLYDADMDCSMKLGEIMLLILEIYAALFFFVQQCRKQSWQGLMRAGSSSTDAHRRAL